MVRRQLLLCSLVSDVLLIFTVLGSSIVVFGWSSMFAFVAELSVFMCCVLQYFHVSSAASSNNPVCIYVLGVL